MRVASAVMLSGLRRSHVDVFLGVLLGLAAVLPAVWTGAGSRHRTLQELYDPILVARCAAKCAIKRITNNTCIKTCAATPMSKLGECPGPSTLSVFDAACVTACQHDSQCPEVTKCCKHACGVTCQRPLHLDTIAGLPAIPTNISVTERRRTRGVVLKWKAAAKNLGPIFYVVEERHHAGHHFTESRLGAWSTKQRSAKPSVTLRNVIKPGRWYQFRVAAVTENGTKGFSAPSKQFCTQYGPRAPGPPANLTVGPLWEYNGTLWTVLRWSPPVSDLPIQRYKVFWSRRLQGATTVLDSVLVSHQTVHKDQTSFQLKELQAGSQYFLQVQALSQYGRNRLKGEKAAIILNTTNHTNITDPSAASPVAAATSGKRYFSRVSKLTIHRIYWRKQLLARLSWKAPSGTKRNDVKYTVSWWTGPCKGTDAGHGVHLQHAATVQGTRFDLYDLKFECKYRVSVQISTEGILSFQESTLTFTTPSCESIQLHIPTDESICRKP